MAVCCGFPSDLKASENQGFRASDFLALPDEQKKFWLHGAMLAFSHIAAAKDQDLGVCVHDWYFGEDKSYKDGLILASMEKYSHATPTAVLLALSEQHCGEYRK